MVLFEPRLAFGLNAGRQKKPDAIRERREIRARHPARQINLRGRDERLGGDDFLNIARTGDFGLRRERNHDALQTPRAERNPDQLPDADFILHRFGNAVRETAFHPRIGRGRKVRRGIRRMRKGERHAHDNLRERIGHGDNFIITHCAPTVGLGVLRCEQTVIFVRL
ncbi:MAG: hypothetical protein HDKAJFGB_01525 [Anaerolineae bacterium]|nr:hypothetical protein [Anaerolineae bacterium]